MVPIFALPDKTAIPANAPNVVLVVPLDVKIANPATVLFCKDDAAPAAVKAQFIAI